MPGSLIDQRDTATPAPNLALALLRRLLSSGTIANEHWAALPADDRQYLESFTDLNRLADALTARKLLTAFQAARLRSGALNGLVLGNYRLLEKIGSGGMGVVFRAEHRSLKSTAAVKAIFVSGEMHRSTVERFFQEVRAVTLLRHPNIVGAIDAGEEPLAGLDGGPVPYLVMEYVPGQDLDKLVTKKGPLPVATACQHMYQIADALTEAHRLGLVHRDIKPSNILITPDGRAKLLDFGVARFPMGHHLTQDGARIGTLGYMAPEQSRDPRLVDARADIFGLAATLFFALTGQDPFLPPGGAAAATHVPALAELRPDIPPRLAEALSRMMALDVRARTPSAAAAMRELTPFLGWSASTGSTIIASPLQSARTPPSQQTRQPASASTSLTDRYHRILIVDDEEAVRRVCQLALSQEAVICDEASSGTEAMKKLSGAYDLILLDIDLPGLNGELVLRKIRQRPPAPHLKIIMFSGRASGDELSRLLAAGADDFLTKPFSVVQLRARVKAALRMKDALEQADKLSSQLANSNSQLDQALVASHGELIHARGALVLSLAKLVEQRSAESGGHLIRLQRYCRVLGEAAATTRAFANRLEPDYLQLVEAAAPLHDIGKVAVPDVVLNKSGSLTPEERLLMQAHTTAGAETLLRVMEQYPYSSAFFTIALEIVRSHHERWDGSGYPDRLSGEGIPLSARLVAIADVYDALRSQRVYKPALDHASSIHQMLERSHGHFDPALLSVFKAIAPRFEQIYRDTPE